jgi:hypothetical protein
MRTFALAALISLLPLAPALAADMPMRAEVFKDKRCGCCEGWVEYLQQHGWQVTVHDTEDMETVKDRLGVPEQMRSCHTAKVGPYVVEGHVPLEAIEKLFKESPKVTGIASPGMPQGSPGMSGEKEPNPVVTFGNGGAKLMGVY